PLPLRSPHPLATHIAIDTAVTFLATVILGLIFGVPFLVIVAVAIAAGRCLAPFTRRTEVRQLAERAEHAGLDDEHPSAGDEAWPHAAHRRGTSDTTASSGTPTPTTIRPRTAPGSVPRRKPGVCGGSPRRSS